MDISEDSVATTLHGPKPPKSDTLFTDTFYLTDSKGVIRSGLARVHPRLTASTFWIFPELSLPLVCIEEVVVCTAGLLPKRRFLMVTYRNPVTNGLEVVALAAFNLLNLTRTGPISALRDAIEEARATAGTASAAEPAAGPGGTRAARRLRDMRSGTGMVHSVLVPGGIAPRVVPFQRPAPPSLPAAHSCAWFSILRRHSTGWLGLTIVIYPLAVYRSAKNLQPAFGRVWYLLAVVPTLCVVAVLAYVLAF